MLTIFRTLVEMFGYPGDELYQWGDFIEEHKDCLTEQEFKKAKHWLLISMESSLVLEALQDMNPNH